MALELPQGTDADVDVVKVAVADSEANRAKAPNIDNQG